MRVRRRHSGFKDDLAARVFIAGRARPMTARCSRGAEERGTYAATAERRVVQSISGHR